MRRVRLLVPLACFLISTPSLFAQEPRRFRAETYRSGADRHKVIIPAPSRRVADRLRAAGAELVEEYEGFTLLDVPEALLKQLPTEERVQLSVRDDFDLVLLQTGPVNTRRGGPEVPTAFRQQAHQGKRLHLIQCAGPVRDAWVREIDGISEVVRVTYLAHNAYLLWASAAAIDEVKRRCPFVQWDEPYHPWYKIHPRLMRSTSHELDVTVQLVDHPTVDGSLSLLKQLAKRAIRSEERRLGLVTLRLTILRAHVERLAHLADVVGIEPYVAPKLFDEVQGQIVVGNLTVSGTAPTGPGYLDTLAALGFPTDPGLYPVVDVTDDGFDNGSASAPAHTDFYQLGSLTNPSRIVYAVDRTADGNPHNVGGHGTINAAIVAGYNDELSFPFEDGGGFQLGLGLAPFGRIGSSKIFRDSGPFGLIGSFTGLVSGSYSLGSRISTNSWGANTFGDYGAMDQEYDALVRDAQPLVAGNQQMTIIFAAGNAGPGAGSVGSPGNAKNVITVGAAENVRLDGTDGCGIGNAGADNAQDIIAFSSRGPTDDGRVKPDVVAPGTHIQGAASQDLLFNGTSVCGGLGSSYAPLGQTLYTWSSGTSHSTPAVAGAAALLSQRFTSEESFPPSPAMLKAMVVNATRYLSGIGTGGSLPTKDQGWGEVDLGGFFTSARFARDQLDVLGDVGQSRLVTGVVDEPAKPVKIMLAWTDPPGPTVGAAFVNDLDLEVTSGGVLYRGNHFAGAFSVAGGAADPANNVEAVFLPAGTTGNIAIEVTATTIAGDGVPGNGDATDQDFALSVLNAVESPVPVLIVEGTTVNDGLGNGSGALDPGEAAELSVELRNAGLSGATGIDAVLSSATPGVSVTQANSAYPGLAPAATQSNLTPFALAVDSTVPCGTPVDLALSVTTLQGPFVLPAAQRVGKLNPLAVFSADFESSKAGFEGNGLWHREKGCSAALPGHSPVTTFYYGKSDSCNYDVGTTSGTLTSPTIDLSGASAPVALTFDHLLSRESGFLGSFDIARVELSKNGGPFSVIAGPFDSTGGFVPVSVDLSAFAGSLIQLRWSFATVDGQFNQFEGWHIDDVVIEGTSVLCEPVGPPSNQPPILDPIGDKSVDEGALLSVLVSATDPDAGDVLTLSATNLPAGATFTDHGDRTGTFSWPPTFDQAGVYPNIHFEASDGTLTDSEDITITVLDVVAAGSRISGTVTSAGGPMAGASVALVRKDLPMKSKALTDAAGFYAFAGLDAGSYLMKVSKSGFKPAKAKVALAAGEERTVNFVLKPK